MSGDNLTTGVVPISDTTVIAYNDLVIPCEVDSDLNNVVISGKIPKPSIRHEGAYIPQSQTVKLVVNRAELVEALRGDS